MDRSKYPPQWEEFSRRVRFGRAGGRCECPGKDVCGRDHGGRCGRSHGDPIEVTVDTEEHGEVTTDGPGHVVLTVAHLDQPGGPCRCEPKCAQEEHVLALCQSCHLLLDLPRHMRNASRNRDARRGQLHLFDPFGAQ